MAYGILRTAGVMTTAAEPQWARDGVPEDLHRVGEVEGPCHQDRLEHQPNSPLGVGVEPEGVDTPGVLPDVAGEHGDEEGGRGSADEGAGGLLQVATSTAPKASSTTPDTTTTTSGSAGSHSGTWAWNSSRCLVRWPVPAVSRAAPSAT